MNSKAKVGLSTEGGWHSPKNLSHTPCIPPVKVPMPPRLWISSNSGMSSDDSLETTREGNSENSRSRTKHRWHKCSYVPIGIFWDIENCHVPRGCSAMDVVAAIRSKFLVNRREAEFLVVCDVRKETQSRLQELHDAQVNVFHVCGTQKNAADDKLRQHMRRFVEIHSPPAALLLISGDVNFSADLNDFRYRKHLEVILVHKKCTSPALINCATSHYNYSELTEFLPRISKNSSISEEEDESTCEIVVDNLPLAMNTEKLGKRLRRLADNCGGKVIKVTPPTATLRFATPVLTMRALKRMNGEDVFGHKISTRNARASCVRQPPVYSSDEGYTTGHVMPQRSFAAPSTAITAQRVKPHTEQDMASLREMRPSFCNDWALAQQLPPPPPPPFCQPGNLSIPKLRKIRGTHGSKVNTSFNSTESALGENTQSRAVSPWNSSASFSERSSESEGGENLSELTVSNLPLCDTKVLKTWLEQLFSKYVQVVCVSVWTFGDGPVATVALKSESDARIAINRIHKRKLDNQWAGRRLELSLGRPSPSVNLDLLRTRLRAILLNQPNYTLPLVRLRDAYASRHGCALSTSDLMKVKDTVIFYEYSGRMVQLIDLTPVTNMELEESQWKCNVHSGLNIGTDDCNRIMAPAVVDIARLSKHTHILLETHNGVVPLLSFVDCYEATFGPLTVDVNIGVPLEYMLRSMPTVGVKDTPCRHIAWSNRNEETPSPASQASDGEGVRERRMTAPTLEPMLALFERELMDLLRTVPRCCIPFSKLIPAFHHHFGRQCRVADYGFTKLPDLLAALNSTIVVFGSGSSRVITLSASAQNRRWTTDLVKLLKAQSGRSVSLHEIPSLYQVTFSRPFIPADYGVCFLQELMTRVSPQAVVVCPDGSLTLPRPVPTTEERHRCVQFAFEVNELLCHSPNLRIDFSRFVPTYHAHFGRQLRVALYGCNKLVELFELIPYMVTIKPTPGGDRFVRLAVQAARRVIGQRLQAICPVRITSLSSAYTEHFSETLLPDVLDVYNTEELVFAAGGYVENMVVNAPGATPKWATAMLTACAVLTGDCSIAVKGSAEEYFNNTFKDVYGVFPDKHNMKRAGVITCFDNYVQLTPIWRNIWRLAQILSVKPMSAQDIMIEYTKQYESISVFHDLGFESGIQLMRNYIEVFAEQQQMFSIAPGVHVPRAQCLARPQIDFTIYDTPPGHKGSSVFDSPRIATIWSPPASDVPVPTAFLTQDSKRRTRLAAQFDIA